MTDKPNAANIASHAEATFWFVRWSVALFGFGVRQ